jgi:hypothetical protein
MPVLRQRCAETLDNRGTGCVTCARAGLWGSWHGNSGPTRQRSERVGFVMIRGPDRNGAGQPLDPQDREGGRDPRLHARCDLRCALVPPGDILRFEPEQAERERPAAASKRSPRRVNEKWSAIKHQTSTNAASGQDVCHPATDRIITFPRT